jgi:radical SAM superfamily enzyme YgiQ (UPF0313 family)
MNVLLVNPPFYRFLKSCHPWLSLGLAYVGTALAQAGHRVMIVNLDRPAQVRIGSLRDIFAAAPEYGATARLAGHPAWEELRSTLRVRRPDVVGVTVTTPTLTSAMMVARIVRRCLPGARLMAGGPHATLRPFDLVDANGFDVVVRGEGEAAAVEVLADMASGRTATAGTTWATENGPKQLPDRQLVEDLDAIEPPDLSLYAHPPATDLDLGLVAGSRGCPGSCAFCASPVMWRHRLRLRTPELVAAELEDRVRRFGVRRVYFTDDQWNADMDRAKRLSTLIAERCPGLAWICEARVKPFDEELAQLMKRAGCERVKIGVESGSDHVLASMGKGFTVADTRRCVALLQKTGLRYTAYVMLGMPGETPAEAKATADLIEELGPAYVSVSIATSHPGTPLAARERNPLHSDVFHQSVDAGRVDATVLERLLAYNERPGRNRL